MECMICRQKIKCGEQIFFGSQGVCLGEFDWGYGCSDGTEELVGSVHISCLQSPAAAIVSTNTALPECVEEECVVQRSDALALLDI